MVVKSASDLENGIVREPYLRHSYSTYEVTPVTLKEDEWFDNIVRAIQIYPNDSVKTTRPGYLIVTDERVVFTPRKGITNNILTGFFRTSTPTFSKDVWEIRYKDLESSEKSRLSSSLIEDLVKVGAGIWHVSLAGFYEIYYRSTNKAIEIKSKSGKTFYFATDTSILNCINYFNDPNRNGLEH